MLEWPRWEQMFVPSMSLLEIFLRGSLIYLGLVVVFRVVLNRQAGNVGLSDVLLVVLIGDAAQNGMGSEYRSVTEGLLLISTLVFWDYALDWLNYHVPCLRAWFVTRPLLLIREGKVQERNLRQELITKEELLTQLRLQGIQSPDQVREAKIESSGEVSVIPAKKKRSGGGKKRRRPA
ncbi:MAG: DUF421 domain-containing protein [Planctomycetes bacterium]|nr:DUF421 domain-containing protein [Planctomycetota bacterium]